MARVRPGVCETRAAFSPTSAFSKLDLPTFDRPRKAISGAAAAGNCAAERAESRNLVTVRMDSRYETTFGPARWCVPHPSGVRGAKGGEARTRHRRKLTPRASL